MISAHTYSTIFFLRTKEINIQVIMAFYSVKSCGTQRNICKQSKALLQEHQSRPSKRFPQVCAEGPNVCSFRASNSEYQILPVDMQIKFIFKEIQTWHENIRRLSMDLLLSTWNLKVGKGRNKEEYLSSKLRSISNLYIDIRLGESSTDSPLLALSYIFSPPT